MTKDEFVKYFGHDEHAKIIKAKAKRQMRSMKKRGVKYKRTWLQYVKPPIKNNMIDEKAFVERDMRDE